MSSEKMWLPLESNPEVMERYLSVLGAKEGTFSVSDVYGLDDDLLAMVPPTVVAVLMLFPLTAMLEKAVEARDAAVMAAAVAANNGRPLGDGVAPYPIPDALFFMQQFVGNACGTIGLLHAIINNQMTTDANQPRIKIGKGSFIDTFMKRAGYAVDGTTPVSSKDRGVILEEASELDGLHLTAAVSGQSDLPDESKEEDDPHNRIYHFIAFVAMDGYLWELDGRRNYPHRVAECGETTGMPLLTASARAIEWYMAQDPDNIQFGLTALVTNDGSEEDL